MTQHQSDPGIPPGEGSRLDEILIRGPGFWQMFCHDFALCLALLGVFAIFQPQFVFLTGWLVLLPSIAGSITNWLDDQRKAAFVFRQISSVLPEIDGERILSAGVSRRKAGFGKFRWEPVFLTKDALFIGACFSPPDGTSRRLPLADMVKVGSFGDGIRLRLRSGENVKLAVLGKRTWRQRIEASLVPAG